MLTETLKHWALQGLGLPQPWGLIVAGSLMALESMIAPVPSEIVMPPLGMLVYSGKVSWEGAIIATSIGSLIGSLISYWLGCVGGKPLVMKVGKYLLVNEEHLDLTTRWFGKWGSATVFVCRFIPVVRHLISIPAGIARMNLWKFSLYTLIGATMWNTFLLWLGYRLEDKWEIILKYRGPIDVAIVVGLVLAVAAWFYLHLRKKPVPAENRSPN
jgi:membrane protein DedA with SNARE-associated domain